MSHSWVSWVIHTCNESLPWLNSVFRPYVSFTRLIHLWMSDVTNMSESCHTYQRISSASYPYDLCHELIHLTHTPHSYVSLICLTHMSHSSIRLIHLHVSFICLNNSCVTNSYVSLISLIHPFGAFICMSHSYVSELISHELICLTHLTHSSIRLTHASQPFDSFICMSHSYVLQTHFSRTHMSHAYASLSSLCHKLIWHELTSHELTCHELIYEWDSYASLSWLVYMSHKLICSHFASICLMRISHSYARHVSFICVPWLIHLWLLIHMCAMIHSYVCHDSFICVACLIHMCAMTRFVHTCDVYVWLTWLMCRSDWNPPGSTATFKAGGA